MNTNMYSTSDFHSACVLRACNIGLSEIVKKSNKTVEFVFEGTQDTCKNVLKSHWDRELKIPTKDLLEAISELKTRMYSVLSNDKANKKGFRGV